MLQGSSLLRLLYLFSTLARVYRNPEILSGVKYFRRAKCESAAAANLVWDFFREAHSKTGLSSVTAACAEWFRWLPGAGYASERRGSWSGLASRRSCSTHSNHASTHFRKKEKDKNKSKKRLWSFRNTVKYKHSPKLRLLLLLLLIKEVACIKKINRKESFQQTKKQVSANCLMGAHWPVGSAVGSRSAHKGRTTHKHYSRLNTTLLAPTFIRGHYAGAWFWEDFIKMLFAVEEWYFSKVSQIRRPQLLLIPQYTVKYRLMTALF